MGIITQGIVGGVCGKTGPLIGSSWKGRAVLRAKPMHKKNKKYSQSQLDQQEKFKLMRDFLIGVEYLLLLAYKTGGKLRNGFQEAFSVNLRDAITGAVSPFAINYSNIKLSDGGISVLPAPVVTAETGNIVKLVWHHVLNSLLKASDADKAVAVLYSDLTARRSTGELLFNAATFTGKNVHIWFLFLSDDETKASKSQYLGTVMVTP
jgi:hypothetical protein